MTFGLVANGDNNSLLFSTDTDNLFFQGKATLLTSYTSQSIDYWNAESFGVLYNWPNANFYKFTITLPAETQSIIPFVYNSLGKRVSIVSSIKQNSTDWEILVVACTNPNDSLPRVSSTLYVPTIYVFSNYIDSSIYAGNGINVFDANGRPIFTTNEKPLLIKAAYAGNIPYSNLTSINEAGGNLRYIGNGPNRFLKYKTFFDPISSVSSISKPSIFYSCNQTTVGTVNTERYIYESTASFSQSDSKLAIEWSFVGSTFGSLPTSQSTVTPFFALVIDGAQYD